MAVRGLPGGGILTGFLLKPLITRQLSGWSEVGTEIKGYIQMSQCVR